MGMIEYPVNPTSPETRPHARIFILLDNTPECDGITDRQTEMV